MNLTLLKAEKLFDAAHDPEYRFLLIEPALSYGIAFGLILFGVGFFTKISKLQIAGLVTTGLAALSFMPYMAARREAMPRIEQIYRLNASGRGKIFTENTILWSTSTWMYTGIAIIAAATMVVGSRRNQLGYGLSAATVLLGLITIQNSLWMHYQDATAVHPNLKAHRAPIEEVARNSPRSSSRVPEAATPRETIYSAPAQPSPPAPRSKFIRPIR